MADPQLVRSKVIDILSDHFPVEILEGTVTLRSGSARAFVEVDRLGTDDDDPTIIRVIIPLLRNVPSSPELFRHIALSANDYIFGHLSLTEDADGTCSVWINHRILGDYLDSEELLRATLAPLLTADDLDDELQSKFGGNRFHES